MQKVEVLMPENLEAAIMEVIDKRIAKALEVSAEVGKLIRLTAITENVDVDGNQMPPKKPRPKYSPHNNPNAPLVDKGDMMDKARWTVEPVDSHHVNIVYSPPDYFDYVLENGRPWMTRSKINGDVRAQILQMMRDAIGGAL